MMESISSDLAFYLKRLRLPRVAEQLSTISQLAAQEDWSYEAFLASLLEAEVFARDQAALERRIRTARFPSRNKTLENFDFTFQTSVRRQVMLQLASLRFIELAQNVIFLGPPGTGKTHLSIALGLKACFAGHQVLFLSAVDMVAQLLEAKKRGVLKQAFSRLAKPNLLIIDEVGYIPFAQEAANLFFQVISRRYESSSLILTSNRAFSAWGQVFGGDHIVAAAMIDRLVHHAEIVSLKGSSWRLKGKAEFAKGAVNGGLAADELLSAERSDGPSSS